MGDYPLRVGPTCWILTRSLGSQVDDFPPPEPIAYCDACGLARGRPERLVGADQVVVDPNSIRHLGGPLVVVERPRDLELLRFGPAEPLDVAVRFRGSDGGNRLVGVDPASAHEL